MKNTTKKLFFVICIQSLLGLQQAHAAIYYVSPAGLDTNNGTTLSTPVKTIKKALSKALISGDIIYVRAGVYTETVSIGQSNITLSAYQTEKPVIDGGTSLPNANWGALVSISGNNNTISGFEVRNSNVNGVYKGGYGIETKGHHDTISNMDVHHTRSQGIFVHGDYSIVQDSKVWQAVRENVNGSSTTGWGSGLSAARNTSSTALKKGITSYPILRRNTVFNNWGEGISCFETDHCTMEDNITYDNWTINLYLSDTTNSLVQRNVVYVSSAPTIVIRNNSRPGILLADEIPTVPRSANNTIINNFIYNADFDAFSWSGVVGSGLNNVLIANNTIVDGGLFTGAGGTQNIINVNSQIRNNIILGRDSRVPSNKGITLSNNNWSVPVVPALGKSTTDIVGNPQITRTGTTTPGTLAASYFKLLTSSPMVNKAVSVTGVTQDFFKTTRGAPAPDIGGHEAQ